MGGKVAEEIVYGHDLVTSGVSSVRNPPAPMQTSFELRLTPAFILGPG